VYAKDVKYLMWMITYTVGPQKGDPYPWVAHLWIQPTVDPKYLGKKIGSVLNRY
jgi:hypothetical protein